MGIGKPAAAMFDPAGHGGSVAIGSPNVMIGGKPAGRQGDSVTCIMHGSGIITQGSATVFINGMPAARMGDITGCLIAATAPPILGLQPEEHVGSLDPADNSKTRAQHDEDNEDTVAHAEYIKTDADGDGKYDTHDMSVQIYRTKAKQTIDRANNNEIVLQEEFDMGRVDVKYAEPVGIMGVASGSAEGSVYRGKVSLSRGKKGSAVENPDYMFEGQVDVLHAKAERDVVLVSDGRGRYGLLGKAELSAQAINADFTQGLTLVSMNDYDMKIKYKRGVSGGAVGGGLGAWGIYDANESRFHVGTSSMLKVVIGFEMEWDLSIGKRTSSPASKVVSGSYVASPGFGIGGIPGTVLLGNPTVLIG